ncbi:CTD small phosphatase protein [Fasciola hepatica]|uniref:CTD small phosphatase protein n=1 Tax=Fasciola hepatica TaxID=6192 RepID=A0A4E0RK20_FASHE|nr:CTD small phosphatase protein [Fasciola hepatica]
MTPGMDLLGEIPEDCADKKCLVLDLDETLVHSWFKYVENANFVVPVDLDGVKHQIYVCKRPHLDEFLRAVGPLFECVMFTASLRKYADPVCDFIDIGSYFRHRLFREACVYHQNNLIKDLSRLGRDVDQICIVDNSPVSFLFQPNNALQITSWFDDPTDQALLDLIPYLTALAKSDTVVDYLREFRPPSSAAVAQPTTPSWLLLFNPSLTDDQEGSDGALDDVSYDYTEADAVLSPHFHPLSANTSTSLLRSYLAQADHTSPASTDAQLVVHQHRMQLTNSSLNNPTTVPPPPPPPPPSPLPPPSGAISFVHQVTRPETVGANAIGTRLPNPVELQDMKAI